MGPHYAITIELDGRRHSGCWSLRQGGQVHVSCYWGVDEAEIGTAPPEAAARELLSLIVRRGQVEHAQREAERARMLESLGRKPRG
jgi:hypothetical protein